MAKGIVETERFVLFWGGWPSQWHKARFTIDGITYNCCEQYMMAEKANVFGDVEAVWKILAATNPRVQKAIGRSVRNFDAAVWESVCRGVVYTGNLARFSHNASDRRALLATGKKTIVEASPVDRIWGIGLAPDDPKAQDPAEWRGTNWLGTALMQVREALRDDKSRDRSRGRDLQEQLNRRREIAERLVTR
jgi:ribA/ribD-fused uncharacterized protein